MCEQRSDRGGEGVEARNVKRISCLLLFFRFVLIAGTYELKNRFFMVVINGQVFCGVRNLRNAFNSMTALCKPGPFDQAVAKEALLDSLFCRIPWGCRQGYTRRHRQCNPCRAQLLRSQSRLLRLQTEFFSAFQFRMSLSPSLNRMAKSQRRMGFSLLACGSRQASLSGTVPQKGGWIAMAST